MTVSICDAAVVQRRRLEDVEHSSSSVSFCRFRFPSFVFRQTRSVGDSGMSASVQLVKSETSAALVVGC